MQGQQKRDSLGGCAETEVKRALSAYEWYLAFPAIPLPVSPMTFGMLGHPTAKQGWQLDESSVAA